jgi:hypothetical protein
MKRNAHLIRRLLIGLLIALGGFAYPTAHADEPNQVGLVIAFDDDSVVTYCVEFDAETISGYDALIETGLDVVADFDGGLGAAICAVGGTGCPRDRCLTCDVPNYWGYWHLSGDGWTYSPFGASTYQMEDGDVDGWRWGNADAPPLMTFEEICAAPPTDTPTPTNTPPPAGPRATAQLWLDRESIAAGSCTTLRWDASQLRPDAVHVEGSPVDSSGSMRVCPDVTHTYELRALVGADEHLHDVTLEVTTAPPTATPPSPGGDQAPPSATPTATARPTETPASTTPGPPATSTPRPAPSAPGQPERTPSPTPTLTPIVVARAEDGGSAPPTVAPSATPRAEPARDSMVPKTAQEEKPAGRGALGFLALGSVGMLAFGVIFLGLVSFLAYSVIRRG